MVVTFPKAFTSVPAVVVTPVLTGPGVGTTTILNWVADFVTASQFTFRHLRGNHNTTPSTFAYIATTY